MKIRINVLCRISRQDPCKLLLGGVLDILDTAEVLEQLGAALIAHAGDLIQRRAAHLFAAQLAVILDGKPVDLLLHPADECEQRRCGRNAELTAVRRDKGAGTVMVVLDHAEARHGQPERIEHLLAHMNVAQTAVYHERIRQRRELFVAVHIALHAAREHLAHGGVVVLPAGRARDLELAVVALFRLSLVKDDHRADRILSREVGDVIRLQPERQRRHAGDILQQLERFMPPLGLFLSSFDLLEGVFLREAGQHPAFAALRHGQLDLALRDGRKILSHGLLFLDLMRKQNGFRHGIALGVILLDERGEHLRRVALGDMEERVFLILQRATAVMQHADTRAGLSLHERDDIQLRERTRDNVLLGAQLLDGPQAVAQHGGPLELELFGGFVHFLGQLTLELFRIALEQRNRLLYQRVIFLRADLSGTRRTAAAEVLVEARPVLADVARERTGAAFQVQRLADRVDGTPRRTAAHVRAKIACAVMRGLGNDLEVRIGQRGVQPHIRIALVVLEQDVVLGLVLLYHRVLEHEGFELTVGDDNIEIIDMADELACLGVQPFGRLEVVGHAVFQQLGLADINDLAGLVLVHIHAGLHGQLSHALLELFSCHAANLPIALHPKIKAPIRTTGAFPSGRDNLVSKIGCDELYQCGNSLFLIRAVSDQVDRGALGDAKGQNAEQALGIYAALFLLHQDGRLELICLLNKKSCRAGI